MDSSCFWKVSKVITGVSLTFLHHSSIAGLLLNSEMCLLVTELENTCNLTWISLSCSRLQFPGVCRGCSKYRMNDKTRKWVKFIMHLKKKGNDVLSGKKNTQTQPQLYKCIKKQTNRSNQSKWMYCLMVSSMDTFTFRLCQGPTHARLFHLSHNPGPPKSHTAALILYICFHGGKFSQVSVFYSQ